MYELNFVGVSIAWDPCDEGENPKCSICHTRLGYHESCILIYAEPCSGAANAARCVMMNTLWTQTTRTRSLQSRVHMFGNMLKIWRW